MNRIIFVNPPLTLKERYRYLAEAGSTFPSLGLMYLSSISRINGFRTKIIDASSLNIGYDECISEIFNFKSDIVGLSSVTTSINSAAILAQLIKHKNSNIKVLIGGPHITALPEETMLEFREFDIGIIGEGEEVLSDILNRIIDGSHLDDINGIIYRENGELVKTGERKFIENLDNIPYPAWDLIPNFPKFYKPTAFKFKNLPATYLVTSRGCPYNCIFCSTKVFGKKYRVFSVSYVIGMIKLLYEKYNIKEIIFEDDVFIISRKRVLDFCEKLLESNIKISWSCNVRAESIDIELLKLMKKAGCWQISFGIESGNQHILDFAKKNILLEDIEVAVNSARNVGINTKGFFILGLPGENDSTIKKTIDFALKIGLDDVSISKMTPFPGSEVYNNGAKYGTFEKNWKKMNLIDSVFVPNGLTNKKLDFYHKKFLKDFYLRKNIIFNYIKRSLKNPKVIGIYLKSFWGLLKMVLIKDK